MTETAPVGAIWGAHASDSESENGHRQDEWSGGREEEGKGARAINHGDLPRRPPSPVRTIGRLG